MADNIINGIIISILDEETKTAGPEINSIIKKSLILEMENASGRKSKIQVNREYDAIFTKAISGKGGK